MRKLAVTFIGSFLLIACNNSGEKKGNTDSDTQHYYYVDPGDTAETLYPDSITAPRSDSNAVLKLKFPDKKTKQAVPRE